MKNKYLFTGLILSIVGLVNNSCTKTDPSLTGTASVADFSFVENPATSDTLPYPIAITFTNNSADGFLYQWNFGDNSSLSGVANPVHYYSGGGTYDVRLRQVRDPETARQGCDRLGLPRERRLRRPRGRDQGA